MKKPVCPNCGNKNPKFIQDNGDSPRSFNFTLLCVARVTPKGAAHSDMIRVDDIADDGSVACGMQWCPNE